MKTAASERSSYYMFHWLLIYHFQYLMGNIVYFSNAFQINRGGGSYPGYRWLLEVPVTCTIQKYLIFDAHGKIVLTNDQSNLVLNCNGKWQNNSWVDKNTQIPSWQMCDMAYDRWIIFVDKMELEILTFWLILDALVPLPVKVIQNSPPPAPFVKLFRKIDFLKWWLP